MVRMQKRKRRGKIEEVDPKFVRLTLDDKLEKSKNEGQEKDANQAIDEIYSVVRKAVSNELAQIDDLFLEEAANQNKAAFELELTNLLFEKDQAEK